MTRLTFRVAVLACALVAAGCGEHGIELSKDDPQYGAALIFQQRCAGCHTLDAVGSEGSAVKANSRERRDGPNFNERSEDYESVLYAIRNGGFSSGPMPQNIVVGKDAERVACFVATYSGAKGSSGQKEGPSGGGSASEKCPAE